MFTKVDMINTQVVLMNSIEWCHDDVISDVTADQYQLELSKFRTCWHNNFIGLHLMFIKLDMIDNLTNGQMPTSWEWMSPKLIYFNKNFNTSINMSTCLDSIGHSFTVYQTAWSLLGWGFIFWWSCFQDCVFLLLRISVSLRNSWHMLLLKFW